MVGEKMLKGIWRKEEKSKADEYLKLNEWLFTSGKKDYSSVVSLIVAKEAVQIARKEGEQKCIRKGKLHVTQAFIDAKLELARKEEQKRLGDAQKVSDDLFEKTLTVRVQKETAKELFEEFDKIIEHYKGVLNFWQDGNNEWKKMEYTELKKRFLSKPQSDDGSGKSA